MVAQRILVNNEGVALPNIAVGPARTSSLFLRTITREDLSTVLPCKLQSRRSPWCETIGAGSIGAPAGGLRLGHFAAMR